MTPAIPASPSDSLAWLPATSAAISLRLFAIDAAIIYRPGDLPGREVIQVSLIISIARWGVCKTKLALKPKLWLANQGCAGVVLRLNVAECTVQSLTCFCQPHMLHHLLYIMQSSVGCVNAVAHVIMSWVIIGQDTVYIVRRSPHAPWLLSRLVDIQTSFSNCSYPGTCILPCEHQLHVHGNGGNEYDCGCRGMRTCHVLPARLMWVPRVQSRQRPEPPRMHTLLGLAAMHPAPNPLLCSHLFQRFDHAHLPFINTLPPPKDL